VTDLIILATLLPGPKHGYQLKHEAGIILGQEVLHNNLVYPLLRRFMNNKWVSRKTVPGERGQTRQQYTLTALGRKELLDRLCSFTEQDARSSDGFRLRVGLFQLLEPEVRSRILEARTAFLRGRFAKLTAVRTNFQLDRYAEEVTSQFVTETQAELDWIERLRRFNKSRKDHSHD
jgi:DNA-binding PadR family transcriptional regulator